jgi:hypothetical protein
MDTQQQDDAEFNPERVQIVRRNSLMRNATAFGPYSPEERKQRILARRPILKWLVVSCDNDMVAGSWCDSTSPFKHDVHFFITLYSMETVTILQNFSPHFRSRWFVWASVLSALIPMFPLINLHIADKNQRFWPISDYYVIPVASHTAIYALVIACGVFFTIGSYLLVRAFKDPPVKPVCPCYLCVNDEVFASWMFFVATLVTVPVCAIYIVYFPKSTTFGASIACTGLMSILAFLFALAVYPAPPDRVSTPLRPFAPRYY